MFNFAAIYWNFPKINIKSNRKATLKRMHQKTRKLQYGAQTLATCRKPFK
jgi:hypothetical protein